IDIFYDVSAESSTEFPDRLSLMEVRLQAQEDEITLLKSSLADALRKLRLHDQQIPLLKQQLIAGKRNSLFQCANIKIFPVESGKDQTWSSIVEDAIQPTTIRTLQKQLSKGSEDSQGSCPQTPTSSSPAPPKEPTSNPHGGLLSPIREGEKMLCQSIKMFIRGRPITMYIPSNILNYEELRMDLPSQKLDLDWVYGYRGRDCRANLYLLPSGEAVYFIACVVVLYHIRNQTQRHYQKHTDCVRCLAIHPDKVRVASGQTAGVDKDGKPLQPFVHIWDSKTLVTLQQIGLGTFERGVGALTFSSSDAGTLLCVIDDSNEHMLSVWDWNKNIKHVEVKSTNEAILAVDFSPTDTNNIISCGKSHVYFWTMSAGTLTKKQGIFGKYKKPKFVLCFVFSLTGDVLTGDSEGNILTWGKSAADTKTLGKGAKETFQIMKQTRAHEGSVFAMCVLQGGAILSGGGKDRKVIRWSADLAPERECEIPEKFGAVRTIADVDGEELLVGTTRNAILRGTFSDGFVAIVQGHVDEMWGLATHPTQNIFISCGNDRQVCVWNAEDHKLDWCTTLEESGLCADFSPNGAVVSVGLSTGRWVVLDLQTKEVVSDLTDGNEQLSVMRYSPDGSFLAVGSHDNLIYIYNVTEGGRRYTRFGKCTGHSSFITHLDWSKDGKYIMSNSGDYEILYCKTARLEMNATDRQGYLCPPGVALERDLGSSIHVPLVILPFMKHGDLHSFLKATRYGDIPMVSLTHLQHLLLTLRLLGFMIDIAAGMEYLSLQGFLHRDLAPRPMMNKMLGDDLHVCVADFGLSKNIYSSNYYRQKNMKVNMPVRWMAIESLSDFLYTTKSDVWSFGITMWEITSRGKVPYPGITGHDLLDFLENGHRLKQGDNDSKLYELMLSCWHRDPSQRPGFGELGQSLKALLSELPPLETSEEAHYINLGLEAASDHQDSAESMEPEVERMM
uniref:receptor protein-tyrosine kinase n=1 Tax=Cyprinus carpio TaxID=7962 RepID=A0A8C2H659_CYPCA